MTVSQQCSPVQNGISSDLFNVKNELGVGVYHSPLCWYQVYPLTPNITLIANAQTPVLNAYLTLNFPASPYEINGDPVITLDCLRMVALQTTASQAQTFGFLISGYDENEVYLQKTLTYTAGSTGVFSGNNGFKYIASIQCISATGAATSTISFGTSNVIALPGYACQSINHIVQLSWDSSFYGQGYVSPLTFVTPAFNWRSNPSVTPISLTSSDARGKIVLPTAPNGTRLFTILYYVYGVDSLLQTQLMNNNTMAQQMVGGTADLPLLIAFDQMGMQYPGNLAAYNQLFGLD